MGVRSRSGSWRAGRVAFALAKLVQPGQAAGLAITVSSQRATSRGISMAVR
ncbi:Hypothetical protein CAP_3917 [Chondromyces apiculatus DSM 436]|uniref:Uncharacterized protein n=1 Tax=Chondromyces apiculatus DSM 436 TaxID=1192034 RepID=A0A017TGG4_9BACT|nr:Hypothetical protein CAP_3917 [Chondromyces apiculatus DSM 436]